MRTALLVIAVIAFVAAAACAAMAAIMWRGLGIRSVLDDLSGKTRRKGIESVMGASRIQAQRVRQSEAYPMRPQVTASANSEAPTDVLGQAGPGTAPSAPVVRVVPVAAVAQGMQGAAMRGIPEADADDAPTAAGIVATADADDAPTATFDSASDTSAAEGFDDAPTGLCDAAPDDAPTELLETAPDDSSASHVDAGAEADGGSGEDAHEIKCDESQHHADGGLQEEDEAPTQLIDENDTPNTPVAEVAQQADDAQTTITVTEFCVTRSEVRVHSGQVITAG